MKPPPAKAPKANDSALMALSKGLGFFQTGQLEEARKAFEEGIKQNPGKGELYYYLGLVLNKSQDYDQAIAIFKKALTLSPDIKELFLNLGISYFKTQDLASAQETFQIALEIQPENGSAQFFMGMTLNALQKFEESIPYFDRAAQLDPEFIQLGGYYKGLSYYKLGKTPEAVEQFEKSVAVDPQTKIAKDSQQFIELLTNKKTKSKKNWSANFSAGWEWNDNITRAESDQVSNESDTSYIFEAGGEYTLHKDSQYTVTTGYSFFQSLFENATEFNFQSHTPSFSFSRAFEKFEASMNYSYSYNFLDDKSFLAIHILAPTVNFSLHPQHYMTTSYMLQNKTFFTDATRDGDNHSLGFLNFFFFMDNKAYWSAGYRYSDESTINKELEYAGHRISTTLKLPAYLLDTLKISYSLSIRDYKNVTASINEKRRDEKQTLKASIVQPLFDSFVLDISYTRTESSSNLLSVDFKENAAGFNIGYKF
ncbi:MAG: tetratricopeptide repeat protein [Candidatus Nitrohelix vancouverensis]|uniref:Tetratricopeptide repeat protein n=1 Tax=Candidatus Nitrohelix vancouverensis TaxID=2705534 RepID=A0A7T0C0A5_9BACT|nr:MAG: tetratricopeptide repeat protein [Candidatus Nitrohelix vancouverensis]